MSSEPSRKTPIETLSGVTVADGSQVRAARADFSQVRIIALSGAKAQISVNPTLERPLLALLISGSALVRTGSHTTEKLGQGAGLLFRENSRSYEVSLEGFVVMILEYSKKNEPILRGLPQSGIFDSPSRGTHALNRPIGLFMYEVIRGEAHRSGLRDSGVSRTVLSMAHAALAANLEIPSMQPLSSLKDRALEIIRVRAGETSLTVQRIAEELRISPRHLARVLAPEGGAAQVLRNRRVEIALDLINSSSAYDMSLDEIANHSGLGDARNLRRHIKETTGQTPRSLRSHVVKPSPQLKFVR